MKEAGGGVRYHRSALFLGAAALILTLGSLIHTANACDGFFVVGTSADSRVETSPNWKMVTSQVMVDRNGSQFYVGHAVDNGGSGVPFGFLATRNLTKEFGIVKPIGSDRFRSTRIYAAVMDSDSNHIYVAGTVQVFNDDVGVDPCPTLSPSDPEHITVMKITRLGTLLWCYATGLSGFQSAANDIAFDPFERTLVVTGRWGSLREPFGDPHQDAIVIKLSADMTATEARSGTEIWRQVLTGNLFVVSTGYGVAIDIRSDIYVVGSTGDNDPNPTPRFFQGQGISGGYDAFLMRFNSSGAVTFLDLFGSVLDDEATSIALEGNLTTSIYIGGTTMDTFDNTPFLGGRLSLQGFTTKYMFDTRGLTVGRAWTYIFNSRATIPRRMVVAPIANALIITGLSWGGYGTDNADPSERTADTFVMSLDKDFGNLLFAAQIGGDGDEARIGAFEGRSAVAIYTFNYTEDLFVTGSISGNMPYPFTSFTRGRPTGSLPQFVVKMSPSCQDRSDIENPVGFCYVTPCPKPPTGPICRERPFVPDPLKCNCTAPGRFLTNFTRIVYELANVTSAETNFTRKVLNVSNTCNCTLLCNCVRNVTNITGTLLTPCYNATNTTELNSIVYQDMWNGSYASCGNSTLTCNCSRTVNITANATVVANFTSNITCYHNGTLVNISRIANLTNVTCNFTAPPPSTVISGDGTLLPYCDELVTEDLSHAFVTKALPVLWLGTLLIFSAWLPLITDREETFIDKG